MKDIFATGFSKHVMVYGSGTYSERVIDFLESNEVQISNVIDTLELCEAKDFEFKGFPLISLESLPEEKIKSTTVIIGIHNFAVNVSEIRENLIDLGFPLVIFPTQLPMYFSKNLDKLSNYMFDPTNIDQAISIEQIRADQLVFLDEESRILLNELINYRNTGNPDTIHKFADLRSLYNIKSNFWLGIDSTIDYFLDCGAFNGDTLRYFAETDFKILNWVAFEPNLFNCAKIIQSSHNLQSPFNLTVFQNALWSRNTLLKFTKSSGTASDSVVEFDATNSEVISAVSIDNSLILHGKVLIKFDIEGSELEALAGATRLIRENLPWMMISVYHKPFDIFEIQEFVQNLNLGYNFILRSHGFQSFDTVLYCVPPKF